MSTQLHCTALHACLHAPTTTPATMPVLGLLEEEVLGGTVVRDCRRTHMPAGSVAMTKESAQAEHDSPE